MNYLVNDDRWFWIKIKLVDSNYKLAHQISSANVLSSGQWHTKVKPWHLRHGGEQLSISIPVWRLHHNEIRSADFKLSRSQASRNQRRWDHGRPENTSQQKLKQVFRRVQATDGSAEKLLASGEHASQNDKEYGYVDRDNLWLGLHA